MEAGIERKAEIIKSMLQLALQLATVVMLMLSMYLTNKLAPYEARIKALEEDKVDKVVYVEEMATLKEQIRGMNENIANILYGVNRLNDKMDNHIVK